MAAGAAAAALRQISVFRDVKCETLAARGTSLIRGHRSAHQRHTDTHKQYSIFVEIQGTSHTDSPIRGLTSSTSTLPNSFHLITLRSAASTTSAHEFAIIYSWCARHVNMNSVNRVW